LIFWQNQGINVKDIEDIQVNFLQKLENEEILLQIEAYNDFLTKALTHEKSRKGRRSNVKLVLTDNNQILKEPSISILKKDE
jgi:hypothetical protein